MVRKSYINEGKIILLKIDFFPVWWFYRWLILEIVKKLEQWFEYWCWIWTTLFEFRKFEIFKRMNWFVTIINNVFVFNTAMTIVSIYEFHLQSQLHLWLWLKFMKIEFWHRFIDWFPRKYSFNMEMMFCYGILNRWCSFTLQTLRTKTPARRFHVTWKSNIRIRSEKISRNCQSCRVLYLSKFGVFSLNFVLLIDQKTRLLIEIKVVLSGAIPWPHIHSFTVSSSLSFHENGQSN